MLVSACRKIVSAASAALCGFLFASRIRIYVSVLLIPFQPWYSRGEATRLRVVAKDLFYAKLERTPSEGIRFSSTDLRPTSISRKKDLPAEIDASNFRTRVATATSLTRISGKNKWNFLLEGFLVS